MTYRSSRNAIAMCRRFVIEIDGFPLLCNVYNKTINYSINAQVHFSYLLCIKISSTA